MKLFTFFNKIKQKKKTKKIISFPFFFIFWLGVSGEISTDFYKNKMYKNVVFLSRSYIRSRLWGHNADQEKMSRKNKHILHWMFILRIMFILKRMTIRSFNSNATWHICPLVIMGCHFTWFYLHVLYFCRINIFLNSLFNFCSFFFTSNFPFFFFFLFFWMDCHYWREGAEEKNNFFIGRLEFKAKCTFNRINNDN